MDGKVAEGILMDRAEAWARAHLRWCVCGLDAEEHHVGFFKLDVQPGHEMFGQVIPCLCEIARRDTVRMKRLHKECGLTEETMSRWAFGNFDPQLCQKGPGTTTLEQERETVARVKASCESYASEPKGWIILTGSYGSGKSHLAYAIAGKAVSLGIWTYINTVPALLQMLRAGYDEEEWSFDRRFSDLKDAPLLVLDDLGAEKRTEWTDATLYELVNHRYMQRLPMVVTSNVPIDRWEPRIRSRFREGSATENPWVRNVTIPCGDARPVMGGGDALVPCV